MGGRTVFSRVSGGIVLDSFSIVSLFTGLLAALPAGLLLLIGSSGPRSAGIGAAVSVVWGLTVLVFVSRFAQLGIAGDSEGGLFSGHGGALVGDVPGGGAAPRPLGSLGPSVRRLGPHEGRAAGARRVPGLRVRPARGSAHPVSPGALVRARDGPLVRLRRRLRGRARFRRPLLSRALEGALLREDRRAVRRHRRDVRSAASPLFAIVLPVVVAFVPVNPKAALTGMVPFLLYAVGMVLTLQGKLCGAFAAASLVEEGDVAEVFESVAPAEAPGLVAAVPAMVHSAAPAMETPGPVLGDPKHLHTVWQTRLSAGDAEGALDVAREAIPAGLAKKEPRLAAEIYRRHLDRLPELGLDRTALDLLADQLLRDGDVAAAAWTFSQALDTEPTDPKAFKGLLRVAEHHLDKTKEPLEAIRVYRYLLERAPASPFADHARDLLSVAEKRAARPAG